MVMGDAVQLDKFDAIVAKASRAQGEFVAHFATQNIGTLKEREDLVLDWEHEAQLGARSPYRQKLWRNAAISHA